MRALGATVTRDGAGAWRVTGVGVGNWRSPDDALDFGNSGTGSRLVMGAMATTPITAIFTGDASLRSRPDGAGARSSDRLSAHAMKAQGAKALMPVTVHRRSRCDGDRLRCDGGLGPGEVGVAAGGAERARHQPHLANRADPRSYRKDAGRFRRATFHVEARQDGGEDNRMSTGAAQSELRAVEVPRDPSSAAFALVAALIVPGSEISLPAILLNPRRIGLIETLLEMGADIQIENRRSSGGEEIGDLLVRHSASEGRDRSRRRARPR